MIRICPSILNANFDELPSEIAKVAQVSDLLHLDVMPFFPFGSPVRFKRSRFERLGQAVEPRLLYGLGHGAGRSEKRRPLGANLSDTGCVLF